MLKWLMEMWQIYEVESLHKQITYNGNQACTVLNLSSRK